MTNPNTISYLSFGLMYMQPVYIWLTLSIVRLWKVGCGALWFNIYAAVERCGTSIWKYYVKKYKSGVKLKQTSYCNSKWAEDYLFNPMTSTDVFSRIWRYDVVTVLPLIENNGMLPNKLNTSKSPFSQSLSEISF